MSADGSSSLPVTSLKFAIVGAGFSGLCMAIKLKQAGEAEFLVFDREKRPGGTWWVNSYPGCACDVESHLYSYSFEPNPNWSSMFPPQAEIQAYLEGCADKYGLRPFLRLGTEIRTMRWDQTTNCWQIQDANDNRYSAQFVIAAMGGLSVASVPQFPGLTRFQGRVFHSQQWDHSYGLHGKKVAVIGTGASAIQFVPQIQPVAARVDLYQRTAPWIIPRPQRAMTSSEKARFARFPIFQRLLRTRIYVLREMFLPAFTFYRPLMAVSRKLAMKHLERQVADPALRSKLTPTFTIGCKRVLVSNDYYPAVSQPNVELITDPIETITETGIMTAGGAERPVDAIVLGTGFDVTNTVPRRMIFGSDGADLAEVWAKGSAAYKGTTITGFPNLFVLLGPNTGLGHNSIVFMIESQIAYIMDALRMFRRRSVNVFDVKPEAQTAWNERIQKDLSDTVWQTGGCSSWYRHPVTGRNFIMWPTFTWRFRHIMRKFDPKSYRLTQDARIATIPNPQNNEPEPTAPLLRGP